MKKKFIIIADFINLKHNKDNPWYLRFLYKKEYKSFIQRQLGFEIVDLTLETNHYEPHGDESIINVAGTLARYKLISYLEYHEPKKKYKEKIKADYQFLGFYKEKSVSEMTFREYINLV